jgi:hypothetical protein
VRTLLPAYAAAEKKGQKSDLVLHVVHSIKERGGRFVKMVDDHWWRVDDQQAREKVGKYEISMGGILSQLSRASGHQVRTEQMAGLIRIHSGLIFGRVLRGILWHLLFLSLAGLSS